MSDFPPQGFFGLPNVLRGLVPVAAAWDVAPGNLANSTDGDFTTATTIGSSTRIGAFSTIGTLTWDLGSVQNTIMGFKYGMDTSAGSAIAHIASSLDNITFTRNDAIPAQVFSAAEVIGFSELMLNNARYLQIFVQNDTGGATVDFRCFEAYAFRVVI